MTIGIRRAGTPGAGSFRGTDNEFLDIDQVALVDAKAITASGEESGIQVGDRGTLRLTATVANLSAADTLAVTVETSSDNGASDAWRSIGSFTTFSANGSERKSFPGADAWVRASWVFGGAGAPFTGTLTVSGDAV